jgi:3D (Asp-Asp-Asp) domain-containing protein
VRLGLIRRGIAALATAGVAIILMTAPPRAIAQTSVYGEDEALLNYVTTGKLKLGKRISYRFVCSADCQVTATSTLVLRGPDVGPVVDTGSFPAGEIIEAFLKPNKSARRSIRRNIGSSKLRTSVTATNSATGATDTDTRVFRFRRATH